MRFKNILLMILCFVFYNLHAQNTIDRSIVCPAGQTSTNSTYSVEWTIGDLTVGENETLLQGFNQSVKSITTSVYTTEIPVIVKCFPNPVKDILTISLSSECNEQQAFLIDVYGRIVRDVNLKVGFNYLDMSSYQDGLYFVKISNQSFKILKN